MNRSLVFKIFFISLIVISILIIFTKFTKKDQNINSENINKEDIESNSNVIQDVKYFSKDTARGILLLPDPRELNSNRQNVFCHIGGFSDIMYNGDENARRDFTTQNVKRENVNYKNAKRKNLKRKV